MADHGLSDAMNRDFFGGADAAETTPEERISAAWKEVLGTKAGRIIFMDLLGACAIFESGFTGNSTTYFNLGKRDVGLHILRHVAGQGLHQEEALAKWITILTEGSSDA